MTTNLLADVESGIAEQEAQPSTRFGWLRGFRSARTLTGVVLMALFVLMALIGPLLVRTDPSAVSDNVLLGPSRAHLLGTTHTGQDVLAQLVDGSRISLLTGFVAAALATVLSLLIGLAAGYLGGLSDELLSLVSNIFLVIPSLPLVVILTGALPGAGSLAIIIVISLTSWAWGARVLRAQTLSLRKRDFVEAARASGESTWRIIFREILPNQTAIVAATFLSTVIGAILTQASLAFLGLTDVTQWSWGGMLYWAQNSAALNYGAWWWFVPPGLCIALLGTALSLINFGIDEFINPRLRSAHIATKNKRNQTVRRSPHPVPVGQNGAGEQADAPVRTAQSSGDIVLDIRHLTVEYQTGGRPVRAVDDASLQLRRGQVLGIAGESGSGKSTLAYAITQLHQPPAQITGGQLLYTDAEGTTTDLLTLSGKQLSSFRWEEMSIVLQSAMNALNPLLRIGVQIDDALQAHRRTMSNSARGARVRELLQLVGISSERADAYPHELSGGMRQRVMIAIALTLDPDVIVMDEPTTALDVVTQRQILQRIVALKDQLHFAVIFITHDLSMLIELSDQIAVMYAGRVVEQGPAREFYARPLHPYSQGLLASFPTLSGPKRQLTGIVGAPPDLGALPGGCRFQPRCPQAFDECPTVDPPLFPITAQGGTGAARRVACLLYEPADAVRATRTGRDAEAGRRAQV